MEELSNKNATAFLLDITQKIEEFAESTVKRIIEKKDFSLVYPPNNGLSVLEQNELEKLDNNEYLKNALRKVLANNTANVVFNLLNLLDGTADPELHYKNWTGVKLVDIEPDEDDEPFGDMLHDGFFGIYWEWKSIRGNKGWQLDTHYGIED